MSVADDVQEIFEKLPQAFVPERAANLDTTVQLDLTGEGGGEWFLKVANGTINVNPGRTQTPNLTLSMAASDYVALSRGEVNPVNLFMAGKVKLQGDMTLAMKFPDLFDRDRV